MEIYKGEDILRLPGVSGKQIQGIAIRKLRKIPDERGAIFHMLRADDELFEKFGEIYFSMVYPKIVKGWHIHTEMTLNYAVVTGKIKLVLYDDRKDSETKENILEIETGSDNYFLIKVPPFIWNGFQGIDKVPSIVANCATLPHDPNEIKRLDYLDNNIPYNWN